MSIERRRQFISGMLFTLIGGSFCVLTLSQLSIGTISHFGPGYYPLIVGAMLVAVGLFIVFRSGLAPGNGSVQSVHAVPLKAISVISISIFVFALFWQYLGFVISVMILGFVAASADRTLTIRSRSVIAVSIAAFCLIVFKYGLNLPVRILPTFVQ